MSENWHQSEIRIVINDKSKGSITKHLSCDGLLHYIYIFESAGERIFKIRKRLAKLQAKWLIVLYTPFALDVCPQGCRSLQISKITLCITDRNCC